MKHLPALVLALVVAILIVEQPAHFEHWDEVQLRLGMTRFDLAWHQPHPPGYVLFVLAGRALGFLAHPGRVLSIVATVGWLALVYAWVRSPAVLALAPLAVLSPTIFTHATTGRTYMVEAALWTAALIVSTSKRREAPVALGVLIGLGGGFRPTLLIFGVFLFAIWVWGQSRADVARFALACGASIVAWVLPLALLTGGRYFELVRPLLRNNVLAKSVFGGGAGLLDVRLDAMMDSLWAGVGPLLVVTLYLFVRMGDPRLARARRLMFGAFVAFFFYFFVIYDSDGYSLSYVVPMLTFTVVGALAMIPRGTFAVAAAALIWAFLPGGFQGVRAARAKMRARFESRAAAIATLPLETLVVTGNESLTGWSFRTIMMELPERPVLQLARDPFVPALDAGHPYMSARHRVPLAVADGVDLATLPYFSAAPLQRVVFVAPRESALRIDVSCPTSPLRVTDEVLAVIDATRARVVLRDGRLMCH